jgi:N-acetylmuramoyl-L-alanine amidase
MDKIISPSPNHNERLCPIDTVLLHYTDMESAQRAIDALRNPLSQVSCHYVIDEEGQVYTLVEERKRAWHAGKSFWQGRTDLNSSSVGIELVNPGHSYGYIPFSDSQIEALIELLLEIQSRWEIPSSRILGHSDVAPRRKEDPGHLFPWKRLHQKGLGLWPVEGKGAYPDVKEGLSKIGYETISLPHALLAFQRHFQPHKMDGIADDETLALIAGLISDH